MKFVNEAIRVLKLTRKPTKEEYIIIAKVTGIGMIIIGLVGMIITLISDAIGL